MAVAVKADVKPFQVGGPLHAFLGQAEGNVAYSVHCALALEAEGQTGNYQQWLQQRGEARAGCLESRVHMVAAI